MNAFWSYFWPCFAAGLIVGGPTGLISFRRRARRNATLGFGTVAALILAALWHGPFGGADRFAGRVEQAIHQTLVDSEMTQVTARLHHGPLTRRVMLSGPADDFQRAGLIEYMNYISGVSSATWSSSGGIPLIVEGETIAVLGFLLGLVLAYLAELRRRYNKQWNW